MRIGVVSDTHGRLRPEVLSAIEGVDLILHLGDVGEAKILKRLAAIAPVKAVRGNNDFTGACGKLPETDVLLFESHYLYLLHDLDDLHLDPAAAKFSAVLHGHTHQHSIERRRGVLYFNPGSCGPRRFHLPVTCGVLTVDVGGVTAEVIHLDKPGK